MEKRKRENNEERLIYWRGFNGEEGRWRKDERGETNGGGRVNQRVRNGENGREEG